MSPTDHEVPEGFTEEVNPSPVPPPDYTWRGLWVWAADWPAKDTHKIALLQVVAMADGELGVAIDPEDLAARLERSTSTASQALHALVEVGFAELGAGMNAAGRPIRTFITTKRVDG